MKTFANGVVTLSFPLLAIVGCAGNAEIGIVEAGEHNDPVVVGPNVRPEAQITVLSDLKLPATCFLDPELRKIAVEVRYSLEVRDDSGSVLRTIEDSRDYLIEDFRRFGRLSEMVFWDLTDSAGTTMQPGEYNWYLRVQYHFFGDGSFSRRCVRSINGFPIEDFRVGERHLLVEDDESGKFEILSLGDESAQLQSIEISSNRILDETFQSSSNEREQQYRLWAARYGLGIGRLNAQPGDFGTLLYLGGLELRIPVPGCSDATAPEIVREFFRRNQILWPVDETLDDLEILGNRREQDGRQTVSVRQTHGGVPVQGTETTVAIDTTSRVTSVAGFQVAGITESPSPAHSVAEAVAVVHAAYPGHYIDVDSVSLAYVPEAGGRRGPLVWIVQGSDPGISRDRFSVSAHDLEILDHLEYHNIPDEGIYPLSWPESAPDLPCETHSDWDDSRVILVLRGDNENYNGNLHLLLDTTISQIISWEASHSDKFCSLENGALCAGDEYPACAEAIFEKQAPSDLLEVTCQIAVDFQRWIRDTGFSGPYRDLCIDMQVHWEGNYWDWGWNSMSISESPALSAPNGWYQCTPVACRDRDTLAHEQGHAMTPTLHDLYNSYKWNREAAEILADMIAMGFDDDDWNIGEDRLRICPDTDCGFCPLGYPGRSWDGPENYYPVRESAPWHPGSFSDYRTYMSDGAGNITTSTEVQHVNGTGLGQSFSLFSDSGARNNMTVYGQGRDAYLNIVRGVFNNTVPQRINYDTWRKLVLDRIPSTAVFIGDSLPFSHTSRGSMIAAFDAVQLWSLPEIQTLVPPGYHVTQAAGTNRTREYRVNSNGEIEFREKMTSEPWSTWQQLPVATLGVQAAGGGIRSFTGSSSTWWSWTDPSTDGIVVTRSVDNPFSIGWDEATLRQRLFDGNSPDYLHGGDPVIAEYTNKPYVVFSRDGCLFEMHPEGNEWEIDDWVVSECLVPEDAVTTTPAVVTLEKATGQTLALLYKTEPDGAVGRVRYIEIGPSGPAMPSDIGTPDEIVLNSWCDGCTAEVSCPANPLEDASFSDAISPPAAVKTSDGRVVIAWIGPPESTGSGPNRSYLYTTISNFTVHGWGEHVRTPIQVPAGAELGLGFVDGRLHIGSYWWTPIGIGGSGGYFGGLFHATQYIRIPNLLPMPGGPITPPDFWGI